jgi:hypothetical protein
LYSIYVLLAALAHYAKPISQLSYDECINKQALCTCGSDHLLTERTNYRYAGAISVWFLFVAWSRCCLCIVLTRAHTNQHQQQYNHGQTSSVDMEKTSAKAIEVWWNCVPYSIVCLLLLFNTRNKSCKQSLLLLLPLLLQACCKSMWLLCCVNAHLLY